MRTSVVGSSPYDDVILRRRTSHEEMVQNNPYQHSLSNEHHEYSFRKANRNRVSEVYMPPPAQQQYVSQGLQLNIQPPQDMKLAQYGGQLRADKAAQSSNDLTTNSS